MKTTVCPQRQELQDWLAGRLSEDRSVEIERHFEACDSCLSVAAELPDTLNLNAPSESTIFHQTASDTSQEDEKASPATVLDQTTNSQDLSYDGSLGFLGDPVDAGELGRLGDYRILGILGRGGMGTAIASNGC